MNNKTNFTALKTTLASFEIDSTEVASIERLVKKASILVFRISQSEDFKSGNYSSFRPERYLEQKEYAEEGLRVATESFRKALFWTNRLCKETVGSPFLTAFINTDEDLVDVACELLDNISE